MVDEHDPVTVFHNAWGAYVDATTADPELDAYHQLGLVELAGGRHWHKSIRAMPPAVREAVLFWQHVIEERFAVQVLRTQGAAGGWCVWARCTSGEHPVEIFSEAGQFLWSGWVVDGRGGRAPLPADRTEQRNRHDRMASVPGPRCDVGGVCLRRQPDGSLQPAGGVLVELARGRRNGRATFVENDGAFLFTGIAPGAVVLTATEEHARSRMSARLDVRAEEHSTGLQLILEPPQSG